MTKPSNEELLTYLRGAGFSDSDLLEEMVKAMNETDFNKVFDNIVHLWQIDNPYSEL